MYDNLVQDSRLRKLVQEVLERLPKEAAEVLLDGLTIRDIRDNIDGPCPYAKFSTLNNTVTLSINALTDWEDSAVIGCIVHELAHPFQLRTDPESRNILDDSRIDQIAIRWGFALEIEVMRKLNPLS